MKQVTGVITDHEMTVKKAIKFNPKNVKTYYRACQKHQEAKIKKASQEAIGNYCTGVKE